MKKIFGAIGYSLIENNNYKVLILSDIHDYIKSCDNKLDIDYWLKSKMNTSTILLEEVPRDYIKIELKDLWNSEHTLKLKELYINNKKMIKPIDIRPLLVPFSWEMNNIDIKLKKYIRLITHFYGLKNEYLRSNLGLYNPSLLVNTNLGKHFLLNKKKFFNFIIENEKLLQINIKDIDKNILLKINDILDDIMEWYCIACILDNKNKTLIIHTGLYHSSKIKNYLQILYNFVVKEENGITNYITDDIVDNGCITILPSLDKQFGGFLSKEY